MNKRIQALAEKDPEVAEALEVVAEDMEVYWKEGERDAHDEYDPFKKLVEEQGNCFCKAVRFFLA